MNKNTKPFNPVTFLWDLFRPYKIWVILMIQAPILSSVYVFGNNYSIKLLIDAFVSETYTGIKDLLMPISIFVVAQVGQGIAWRVSNLAEWKAEPYVRRDLILKVYDYIQHHSNNFFNNTQSGSVISKILGIIDGYDYILNLHHTLIRNLCITILAVGVLFFINVQIFIFILAWHIALIAIMYPMCFKLNDTSSNYAYSKHMVLGAIADNITNILSLFYFSKRESELAKIREMINKDSIPKHILLEKYNCKFAFVFNALYWIMLFTVLIFIAYLKNLSQISVGDIIFILLTCITISFNLWEFVAGLSEFLKRMGDFKSSCSVLLVPHEIIDSEKARKRKLHNGSISVDKLCFSYNEGSTIFTDLNLEIQTGEKVGIVGHSGAGKSTLVSLILKSYRFQSGTIKVGTIDIDEITADSLRSQVALIPQDTVLFHRSIGENIGYGGDNPSIEDIIQASKLANIHDFIESLPNKYDTLVGERGIKVSGGQRQRISIARAFIKNAPIIILDEATSSLDTVTESKIQDSISTILEQSKPTVIAIAHRLSTIRHMDRILVMDNGKIVEEGSFESLLKNKSSYFKRLWDSQVNEMIVS